jgi:hypothetical protein
MLEVKKTEEKEEEKRKKTHLSLTVKFDANILAVILRQSVQLHTNVDTKPGPSTGNAS